jgi:phytoene desaturase
MSKALIAAGCVAGFLAVFAWKKWKLCLTQSEGRGKKVCVVGGGLSGLTCAAKLAQLGFSVTILEGRPEVGGLCHATVIDGYTFCDGALFLVGSRLLDEAFVQLNRVRKDVLPLVETREFLRVVLPRVSVCVGPGDVVKFISHDSNEACDDISRARICQLELRKMVEKWLPLTRVFEHLLSKPYSFWRTLFAVGFNLPLLLRAGSLKDELERLFSDDEFRSALGSSLLYQGMPANELPATMIVALVMQVVDGFHIPVGGIGELPKVLNKICVEAGVEIRTNCRVLPEGVIVKSGRVCGVRVLDAEQVISILEFDTVVVSASGFVVFGTPEVKGLVAEADVPCAMKQHTMRASNHVSHTMFSVQLGLRNKIDLQNCIVHYRVPPLSEQSRLFHNAKDSDIKYLSFISPSSLVPEVAPGTTLECFAFLRPDESPNSWTEDRKQLVAGEIINAMGRWLGPLDIAAKRVRSPKDLEEQLMLYDGRIYGITAGKA